MTDSSLYSTVNSSRGSDRSSFPGVPGARTSTPRRRNQRPWWLLVLLCLSASALGAEVITVGPSGDFSVFWEAMRAASESESATEIRVASGTYSSPAGSSYIILTRASDLLLTGGWDDSFDRQIFGPEATTVVSPLSLYAFGNDAVNPNHWVRVKNLTLDGGGPSRPERTWMGVNGATLEFQDVVFRAWPGRAVQGVYSHVSITDSIFTANSSDEPLVASVDGSLEMRRTQFTGNVIPEGAEALLHLDVDPISLVVGVDAIGDTALSDVEIYGNQYEGASAHPLILVEVGNPHSVPLAPNRVLLERLRLNEEDVARDLLRVVASASRSEVKIADSLILGSSEWGVHATAGADARIRLNNLTAIKNAKGVHMFATSDASVALNNSVVVWNDSADINAVGPTTFLSHNWIGTDPGFVDAGAGDFRLRLDAPAVDSGRRMFRTGLGDLDLDGNPRIAGWDVDPGAFEAQTGPPPKNPLAPPCLTSATTTLGGTPSHFDVPICNCFQDTSHPTTQCSLEIPGWPGLDLRFLTPEISLNAKTVPEPGGWVIASNSKIPFQSKSSLIQATGNFTLLSEVSGMATATPAFGEFQFPKQLEKGVLLRSVLYFGSEKHGELAVEVYLDPEQLLVLK